MNNIIKFAKSAIVFVEETHKYKVLGKDTPSVSRAIDFLKTPEEIEKFNSPEFQDFLRPFAIFGTRIHKMTELIEDGCNIPIENLIEKERIAMLNGVEIKQQEMLDGEPLLIEQMLYSFKYEIVGTIDRLYKTPNNKIVLLDIKTGSVRDSHGYQQLFYKEMLNEGGIKVDDIALLSTKGTKLKYYSTLKDIKKNILETNMELLFNHLQEVKENKQND